VARGTRGITQWLVPTANDQAFGPTNRTNSVRTPKGESETKTFKTLIESVLHPKPVVHLVIPLRQGTLALWQVSCVML